MRRRRIIGLKLQNSRLLARNKAYVAHANYMKALFQKLGLSLLVTSTDVTSSGGRPALSYSLASPGYPSTTKHQAEESFTRYIQEIQPLASAMLSKILWYEMLFFVPILRACALLPRATLSCFVGV